MQLRRSGECPRKRWLPRLPCPGRRSPLGVGDTLPDVENILQLSRIFGVTTDYLLREEYGTEELSAVDAVEKGKPCRAKQPFPRRKFRKDGSRRKRPAGPFDSRVHSQRYCPGRTSDAWLVSTMIPSFTARCPQMSTEISGIPPAQALAAADLLKSTAFFAVVGILWLLLVLGAALLLWYYYKWKKAALKGEAVTGE